LACRLAENAGPGVFWLTSIVIDGSFNSREGPLHMAKRVLIDIDLTILAANLSKEEGRPVSEDETRKWLIDAGFESYRGLWIVDEPDLGQLDPSEVRSLEDAPDL
jgi:hypothetical protein